MPIKSAILSRVSLSTTVSLVHNVVSEVHMGNQMPTDAMSCNIGPESALLPGLPDDVAKHCLALVPHNYFQSMGSVCKLWRKFLSRKLITLI